jgi:hypothetical protein
MIVDVNPSCRIAHLNLPAGGVALCFLITFGSLLVCHILQTLMLFVVLPSLAYL